MQLVTRHVIERLSQIRVIFQGARKSLSLAPSPSTRICKVAVGRFVTVNSEHRLSVFELGRRRFV